MASFSVPCPKVSPLLAASSQSNQKRNSPVSLCPSVPRSNFPPQLQGCSRSKSDVCKAFAQLNEVAVEKISNVGLELDTEPIKKSESEYEIPDALSILTFMTQVTDLVKLVDSKDIMELQLKQMDCELLIRKREALPQSSISTPVFYTQSPTHQAMPPPQMPSPAPASVASSPSASVPALPAPTKSTSSHPPFKCPMAGNFYRSSAPGSPAFVKVGDKVQKGQVLCIIEAMKLMNEIEADHSGTVVDILVDDGKPVSVDMPLFIIEP